MASAKPAQAIRAICFLKLIIHDTRDLSLRGDLKFQHLAFLWILIKSFPEA